MMEERTNSSNSSSSELPYDYSPTTEETSTVFHLSDYIEKNYIIIVIPSIFACVFLIIIFILLIRKILNRQSFDPKHLETYSSVNYDDESVDDDLVGADDIMYTSCRLLVGEGYDDNEISNAEISNSEPEYDCMSVDVSVNPKESSIIDWSKQKQTPSPEASQNLTMLPHNFWKR